LERNLRLAAVAQGGSRRKIVEDLRALGNDMTGDSLPASLTAFAAAESELRRRCGDARVDSVSFQRKLAPCDMGKCRGTCCYDGAHVDEDTAAVLQRLATDRAAAFRDMGLSLPTQVTEQSCWRDTGPSTKTAVRPVPSSSLPADFPAHFERTACVFLLADARSGLQVLSAQEGRHPWYYKPFACWLHPIAVSEETITLPDAASDPFQYSDYPGFASCTPCGTTRPDGAPAATVLNAELAFLGEILGRDIAAEAGQQSTRDDDLRTKSGKPA
jgi:hypothetical protein